MKTNPFKFILFLFMFLGTCEAEFHSLYLGQSFGVAFNKGTFSSESSSVALFGLPHYLSLSSKSISCNESLWGEVYGGCGRTYFCHLYLGLRAGMNISDFHVKDFNSTSLSENLSPDIPISSAIINQSKLKLRLVEGTFDQKIGWIFCKNTLLFALVGVAINQPSLTGSSLFTDSGGGDTPFDGNVSFSLDKKGKSTHFRWGIGVEHEFLCHWGVQVLYTHTNYGKINFEGSRIDSNNVDVSLTANSNINTRLSRQVLSFGFVRYF